MGTRRGKPGGHRRRFAVAFSFPGEHRHYVQRVDQALRKLLPDHEEEVFLDERYQHELVGFDGDLTLQEIYHNQTELIVVFLCKEYNEKEWCGLEWRAILDLVKTGRERDVLPFRFDDAPIPGVFSTVIHADPNKMKPPQAARLIYDRLRLNHSPRGELGQARPKRAKPVPGELHNVPDPPRHYQDRPALLEQLKQALLSTPTTTVGLVGSGAKLGVHGRGGVGKTVLAAAAARDEDVRRAFPDGVIWLTIGKEATESTITTRQLQVAQALGDHPRPFEDSEQGRGYLEDLLRDRACLVVLDDVWRLDHATPFGKVGERCRLVVTTRDAEILGSLGADRIEIDRLDPDQALRLLGDWAGTTPDALPDVAGQVAKRCGYLALAMAMIGAMVRRRPDSWTNALSRLRRADLAKIRAQFPDYAYPDLLRAIQASVDALDETVRDCYLDLGVFPEDTSIPEPALVTFWTARGLDEGDAADVVDRLVDLALLRREQDGRLRLHDLQMDYVRKQVRDVAGLHAGLLDAYRRCCADGWHTLEADGYIHEHLPYHLMQAGREDELRDLLVNFDWLQAKLQATDVVSLLADYDLWLKDKTIP